MTRVKTYLSLACALGALSLAPAASATVVLSAPGNATGLSYAPGTVVVPQNEWVSISVDITPDSANLASERILDNITAGGVDGWLIDIQADHLRVIDGSDWLQSAASIQANVTRHILLTYSGSTNNPTLSLYENGVLTGTLAEPVFQNMVTEPFRIGFDSNNQNVFTGSIDNVLITAGVPESGAWTSMILGLGLAGGALRSVARKSRPQA